MITWDDVGYYSRHSDKKNTFQAILVDRSDTGKGNFDVEFRYGDLQWTSGDASGGRNGLGGLPAQAGYDAGDGKNFFLLPGSRTAQILELATKSNTGTPGEWRFSIRDGKLPGGTRDNPLKPIANDEGWEFDLNISSTNEMIYIDPVYAIGYDYVVDSGPNITSVLLPTGIGDNLFDLWLFDPSLGDFFDTGVNITGGIEYFFDVGGVDMFRILGIELDAMLDPNDTTAFVTGLRFASAGAVSMRQIPITFDTEVSGIPEPASPALIALGLSGLMGAGLRRRRHQSNST